MKNISRCQEEKNKKEVVIKKSKMSDNKLRFIWVLVCIIINFLVDKNVISSVIYSFIATPLAVYLFPVQPIKAIIKRSSRKTIFYSLLSNFVLSVIVCFSIIRWFLPKTTTVEEIFTVFLLINGIMAFVHLFITDNKDDSFLHFLFCMFRLY